MKLFKKERNGNTVKLTFLGFIKFSYKTKEQSCPPQENSLLGNFIVNLGTLNAIKQIKDNIGDIQTVVDVGASDGRWSKEINNLIPQAAYLLIEANEHHKPKLDICVSENKNMMYELCAASNQNGEIYFDASDDFAGIACQEKLNESYNAIRSCRIDDLVNKYDLKGGYLLKLDTHGFELPILEGAENVLANAELVIIETYNFKLNDNALRFWEMCKFMDEKGFLPINIAEPLWRSYDNSFWQIDILFAPKTNKVFSYNQYR